MDTSKDFIHDYIYDKKKKVFIVPIKGSALKKEKVDESEKEKVKNSEREKGDDKIREIDCEMEKSQENERKEGQAKNDEIRQENFSEKNEEKKLIDNNKEAKEYTFETLYNSKEKFEKNGVQYVLLNNCYYSFSNPYYIKFTFPDGEEKNIFIPKNQCIYKIINEYKNYDYLIKIDGSKEFIKKKINYKDKYSEIKFISSTLNKDNYLNTLAFVDFENRKEFLSLLSPVFNKYFENKIITESKPIFKYTKERKLFFSFLEDEINESQLIPLCGPEGIGKTISILTFFRQRKHLYKYIYCNLKKLYYYFIKKNTSDIKNIMINELFQCENFDNLNQHLIELENIFNNNDHPIDILDIIISKLDLCGIIIILDQYKIKYDYNYLKLQNLIKSTLSREIKIIVISSMNEFDVKESILDSLEIKNKIGFSLNYIYISSLVSCDEEDVKQLNEEEKSLLINFGNTYQAYYEIITQREKYKNQNEFDNFVKYFEHQMKINFECRINDYFNNENKDKDIQSKLYYLINCTNDNLTIKDLIENSNNIPFRFFIFKYADKTYFKISNIKVDDKIELIYQCNIYFYYISSMYQSLIIKNQRDPYNKSLSSYKKATSLEESFSRYLACRADNFIKNINKIVRRNIEEFYNIKKEDLDVDSLNNNEAILFTPLNQNTSNFNCAILLCINKDKKIYHFYLFQVTRKKSSKERMSYLTLNDNINYLKLYLISIYGIKIDKVFFAYVFDFDSQDNTTMDFCVNNNIDYIIFDMGKFNISEKFKLNEYIIKLKIFDYNFKDNKSLIRERFTEINKNSNGKLDDSLDYLKKKRKMMNDISQIEANFKNKKNEEKKKLFKINTPNIVEEDIFKYVAENQSFNEEIKIVFKNINLVNNYFKNSRKSNQKLEINEIQKEKIVQDYLLENSKFTLPGISYFIENQNIYIKELAKHFSIKEIKKLFGIIFKNEKDHIVQIKELNVNFIITDYAPEYKTNIVIKFGNKGYYLNYCEQKYISLLDDKDISFDIYLRKAEIYAISWATLKKNNNDIINFIKK